MIQSPSAGHRTRQSRGADRDQMLTARRYRPTDEFSPSNLCDD